MVLSLYDLIALLLAFCGSLRRFTVFFFFFSVFPFASLLRPQRSSKTNPKCIQREGLLCYWNICWFFTQDSEKKSGDFRVKTHSKQTQAVDSCWSVGFSTGLFVLSVLCWGGSKYFVTALKLYWILVFCMQILSLLCAVRKPRSSSNLLVIRGTLALLSSSISVRSIGQHFSSSFCMHDLKYNSNSMPTKKRCMHKSQVNFLILRA